MALWRVGQTSYLVEHDLSDEEKALADTDGAMRARGVSRHLDASPAQRPAPETGAHGVGDMFA